MNLAKEKNRIFLMFEEGIRTNFGFYTNDIGLRLGPDKNDPRSMYEENPAKKTPKRAKNGTAKNRKFCRLFSSNIY